MENKYQTNNRSESILKIKQFLSDSKAKKVMRFF